MCNKSLQIAVFEGAARYNEGVPTREKVRRRLERGIGVAEIARTLGISKATVCYHARRLGYPASSQFARRYDWGQIQAYYDAGQSFRACQRHFGFSGATWTQAVARGDITPRPRAIPLREVLVAGRRTSRYNLKLRLIAEGLKRHACEECGISEWQGNRLSLDLHHRNGDPADNRLENLNLLCPNCHSQTDTFGVRNRAWA